MTDRELDAVIEEKLFGSKPCDDPAGKCPGSKTTPPVCWVKRGEEYGSHLPFYSTDIAAAWKVVEEVEGLGKRLALVREGSGDGWEADFGHGESALENEPSRAICMAALRAIHAEVKP